MQVNQTELQKDLHKKRGEIVKLELEIMDLQEKKNKTESENLLLIDLIDLLETKINQS
mgnify:CR=1 FL=1